MSVHAGRTQPPPRPVQPPAVAPAKAPTAIAWQNSLAAALTQAKASHRLVMVHFYAEGCEACREMDKTYRNARVVAAAAQFVSVKVDIGAQQKIADRYGVTGTPTVAWLDAGGKLVYGFEGASPAGDLLDEMQTATGIFQTLTAAHTTAATRQ